VARRPAGVIFLIYLPEGLLYNYLVRLTAGVEVMRTDERLRRGRQTEKPVPSRKFVFWLLIFVALTAAFLLIRSEYFSVGSVVVEGNNNLSVEDVYRTAQIPAKINIFRLSTGEIQKRLLGDLRVETADVHRRLPATIVISLTERKPLAYVASSYGFVQLDRQGVVLVALKNIKQMNAPIITGVQLDNIYVGDKVEPAAVHNVLAYLTGLDANSLNQLSEVNIGPTGELTAYTATGILIRLGDGERLAKKAGLTSAILRDIGDKKTAVEYIDLKYSSPYIKISQ
jgi:cell division protein FtsQ